MKCQFLKSGWKLGASAILISVSMSTITVQAHPKKIEWKDFEQIVPASDMRSRQIAQKTDLSFVVNTHCAARKLKTLKPGGVLNSVLARAARHAGAAKEHSVGVRLTSNVDFEIIEKAVNTEKCVKVAGVDGDIELAQANILTASNDPERTRQGHLDYLHFEEGISLIAPVLMIRTPVTIAIIDAGVDLTHKDLASGAWRNPREIASNGIDDDSNGYIDDVNGYNFGNDASDPSPRLSGIEGKHGTHVAGLAAARWSNGVGGEGIAGFAKIMSLNVFGTQPTTKSSTVENAIRYAARNGAQVINLSLSGSEYSRTMLSALQYAVAHGSFIVAASGNIGLKFESSPNSGIFFSPAAYGASINGMVTVASVDTSTHALSRFSNYNRDIVQIAAPGAVTSTGDPEGIWSSFPGNTYGKLAGTSMSAPLVSGAAALAIAYFKACGVTPSPSTIKSLLLNGSSSNSALNEYVDSGRELDILSLARNLKSSSVGHCQ